MARVLTALLLGLVLAVPVAAAEKVKIGVLKLTSSAPIFIGVEKGFFREFGVDPELVFFQAAAALGTARAAGQVGVGAAGRAAGRGNNVGGGG